MALAINNKARKNITTLLAEAERSPMPENIKPMLATLVDEPFDDPEWMYEVKWDGYRAVSYIKKGNADIRSRNNKSFNDKYYPLRQILSGWKINAVIDGEIVVLNDKGQSNFGHLQSWRSEADGHFAYCRHDFMCAESFNTHQAEGHFGQRKNRAGIGCAHVILIAIQGHFKLERVGRID